MTSKKHTIYTLLLWLALPIVSLAADNKTIVTPLTDYTAPTAGLQGSHLAVWNSHGLYYNQIEGKWRWQRARLLGTVEDLHTTDYVLNYLVPMLENAGAYVFLPRERDTNPTEVIVDNDGGHHYQETGKWEKGLSRGFAHKHSHYEDCMNPFEDGTYRHTRSVKGASTATATWQIPIEKAGEYAVYVAYKSFKSSATDVIYTVHHAGGESRYAVNQTMGGGTWIYIGTFEFTAHSDNRVVLENGASEAGRIITADAVKVGGGMGNVARKPCLEPRKPTKIALDNLKQAQKDAKKKKRRKKKTPPAKARHITTSRTSHFPRYAEAARYWMQWAGVPDTIYSDTGGDNDYNDDLRGRGYWVNYLCGGSRVLPDSIGLNIPIDAAIALHSDAGNEPGDSIVGSMAIYYTGSKKTGRRYADKTPRSQSQKLSQCITEKIAQDIHAIEPGWTIRPDRNRRYAEARIGEVPTLLLESMSHQNFTDMRYGLDPRFKFMMSRAVYKGILKYLSERRGTPYVVQPLPVDHMAMRQAGATQIELSWRAVADTLEPTAVPTHYKVYVRRGDHGWDGGTVTTATRYKVPLENDVTYSFYVTALNAGGESFPSETLSARFTTGADECVMIVNAFDRVSAPIAIEDTSRTFVGFRYDIDGGVPYGHTIAYTGEQYEYNRLMPWVSDDDPGFGASKGDYEGKRIAGNTRDYPKVHGEAIAALGYSYISTSAQAVEDKLVDLDYYPYVDLILGKQRTTILGTDSTRLYYSCFTPALATALTEYCHSGGHLLISGAYVGSDLWSQWNNNRNLQAFATNVLHYRWNTSRRSGEKGAARSIVPGFGRKTYHWAGQPNELCYAVEETDVLVPTGQGAATFMQYDDFSSAAVAYDGGTYRCCTLGFPIEAITDAHSREHIMQEIFDFLDHKK